MALWALVLGYAFSAAIQIFVKPTEAADRRGGGAVRHIGVATGLGFISSSCSFAALAATRALWTKGARLESALAFMFASTNLVIELGVLLWIFLGWEFVLALLPRSRHPHLARGVDSLGSDRVPNARDVTGHLALGEVEEERMNHRRRHIAAQRCSPASEVGVPDVETAERHECFGRLVGHVGDEGDRLDQPKEAAGHGLRHRPIAQLVAVPSGAGPSTRGRYSTIWMLPSKVRLSVMSRTTSG